jgi:hypothetical protein
VGEIPASEIKKGDVIRHFFKSDFGLHKIEGTVDKVIREETALSKVEYVSVTLAEAVGSDVSRVMPGVYLYGDGGLRHQNYTFGIMPKVNVLRLSEEPIGGPTDELMSEAVPLRSLWLWSPGDSSRTTTVTVTKYDETPEAIWIHFRDEHGGDWALEPRAFHEQLRFLTFGEPTA